MCSTPTTAATATTSTTTTATTNPTTTTTNAATAAVAMAVVATPARLPLLQRSLMLQLPAELIDQILSHLSPLHLESVSATCHLLRTHALGDHLWQPLVQQSVPGYTIPTASPAPSYRSLYLSYLPYWFLPRNKLWFADTPHTGKLLIARYDHRIGAIEAYSLVAERGRRSIAFWEWKPDVIIHTFNPNVVLDLNAPVVRLTPNAFRHGVGKGNRLQQEIPMDVHLAASRPSSSAANLFSHFMLARPIPPAIVSAGTAVWPPHVVPSDHRVRNASVERYRGTGHKPSVIGEISELAFRLRKWMEFSTRPQGFGNRVGEDVTTFATLREDLYTPTRTKPWRGIWCGDYSGHGCEFLLVMQRDDPGLLPEAARRVLELHHPGSVSSTETWTSSIPSDDDFIVIDEDIASPSAAAGGGGGITTSTHVESSSSGIEPSTSTTTAVEPDLYDEEIYNGRLEAIKLTGDVNIPRGEHTFIAPDIGKEGLVRIATEEIFKGARIVRSVGHIAAQGFREDEFIPSQLILISPDMLAQYWEPFGHISFYRRVDIARFLTL